ncbi:endo alpha-1,4 polygalactosaminidase [Bacillus sp. FJAT-42376]|uniref:putative glycoside hydrolase n=1 Tax=Bacillus sp. FJAT-42376 TaxID=2014076 RepID=UPI0013DE6D48|nr:endo alpha-1,4 polygalactosaminidase [Bacillus sp. FJAT-42376]
MNRKFVLLAGCATLILFIILGSSLFLINKQRNQLFEISSYKIYYDEPSRAVVKEMSRYPLVIIEPVYYTKKQIAEIQENGTLVYGYINSMESDKWNEELFRQFEDQDFYRGDHGERVYIKKWDAYLMNMTSDHYRSTLLEEIKNQIIDKQLDGVFLDTVGDIDDYFIDDPKEMGRQQTGLIQLLKELESRQISVIQNWGMRTLQKTAPYIDGFMWEDFQYSEIMMDDWSRKWMKKTRRLAEDYEIEIFTVSEKEKRKSEQLSEDQGFIHYYAPRGYEEW